MSAEITADLELAMTLGDETRVFEVVDRIIEFAADMALRERDVLRIGHWDELLRAVEARTASARGHVNAHMWRQIKGEGT